MADDTRQDSDYFNAAADPARSNAILADALETESPELPQTSLPRPALRRLPYGYITEQGTRRRDFAVRELTGADEERLARIDRMTETGRWVQVLLECGVEEIAGQPATPDLLKTLVIGDRDYLALAVSEITFGSEVLLGETTCQECEETFEMSLHISDIPIRESEEPPEFEVELKNGGKALLRLPNGNDQLAMAEDPDATGAERKSTLLANAVSVLVDATGEKHITAGFPSLVRNLDLVNRNRILATLAERQPGPRYNEVTYTHTCGHEAPVVVGLMHLFPELF